jgi:hypothetical protein
MCVLRQCTDSGFDYHIIYSTVLNIILYVIRRSVYIVYV